MNTFSKTFGFILVALLGINISAAQEIDNSDYNENSLRPIRNADIMYKNTLWMRMDLREKPNEPFFAMDNEITKVIIQAVKDGVLRPYADDDLNQRMTLAEFNENLKLPNTGMDVTDDCCGGDWDSGWPSDESSGSEWDTGSSSSGRDGEGDGGSAGWDDGSASASPAATAGADEFFASQISTLEMKVDLIYDRKRSRAYRDIQSVTLVIPGEYYPTGIDKHLATFSYKELVENVFLDNPNAIWYNTQNAQENRNLADAFDLGLYSARIIKYANPRDNFIVDLFGSDLKKALGYSQEYEYGLMEYMENLNEN